VVPLWMVKTDSVRNAALKRANGNVQTVELQWIKGINSVRSVVRDEIPKVQNKTIRHIILHHGGSKCWKPDEKQSTYRGTECIIDTRVPLHDFIQLRVECLSDQRFQV